MENKEERERERALTLNILDSFLFLFLSMIVIAASLYLPEHVTTVALRGWFYLTGQGEERRISYGGAMGDGGGQGSVGGGVGKGEL